MNQVTCAEKIRTYLKQNQISAEQAAYETGISLKKLTGECQENLDAAEFLQICFYLNIRPEEMR